MKLATDEQDENLTALLMFLVYEKQVLSEEDDTKELELYFMEEHRERMTNELEEYKRKLNIKPSRHVFVLESENKYFVWALHEEQAKRLAGIKNATVRIFDTNKFILYRNEYVSLSEFVKDKDYSFLIGSN